MSTIIHKFSSKLVNEGGVKNAQNSVNVDYECLLTYRIGMYMCKLIA